MPAETWLDKTARAGASADASARAGQNHGSKHDAGRIMIGNRATKRPGRLVVYDEVVDLDRAPMHRLMQRRA